MQRRINALWNNSMVAQEWRINLHFSRMIPELYDLRRHMFAFLCGLLGGLLPNDKSNIAHWLMGGLIAILATKVVFGDFDLGYQWSWKDIVFGAVVGSEGALGAILSQRLKPLA